MRWSTRLLGCVCSLALLCAGPVWADDVGDAVDPIAPAEAPAEEQEPEPDAAAVLAAALDAYRAGDFRGALSGLRRAGRLEPALRSSRDFVALAAAIRANLADASALFGEPTEQSPLAPLSNSALNLRRDMKAGPVERGWRVGLAAGFEYDTNPMVPPDQPRIAKAGGRAMLRPTASARLVTHERGSLRVGYDGFWSFHFGDSRVDMQTHSAFADGGLVVGPATLALRYEYDFDFVDTTDSYRSMHIVTPSVTFQEAHWGATRFFYQFQHQNYLLDRLESGPLDRDGIRQLFGVNQFFFLPPPYGFVRLALLGDVLDASDISTWSYDGLQASLGAGYDFDYGIELSWLYRFDRREYQNPTLFATPSFSEVREDNQHRVDLEIAKTFEFAGEWRVALVGAFHWNVSNVSAFDLNRQIGSAVLSYAF